MSLAHSGFCNSAISASWSSLWLGLALDMRTNMGRQIARMTEGGLMLAPGQLGIIQQSQRVERGGSSYSRRKQGDRGGCLGKLSNKCGQILNVDMYLQTLFSQQTKLILTSIEFYETIYICCTVISGLHGISTMSRTFPCGLENNHTCKWISHNFPGMLTYLLFLEGR